VKLRLGADAQIEDLTAQLRDAERRQADSDALVESLMTQLQHAKQERTVLRNALLQPDDFERADIVKEFELLEYAMKTWCREVVNSARTLGMLNVSKRAPGAIRAFRFGVESMPLVSLPRQTSPGQFHQWVFCNLRSIVIRLVLEHIFLPFHPSLFRSSTCQTSRDYIMEQELPAHVLRKLDNRIYKTNKPVNFRQWRMATYLALEEIGPTGRTEVKRTTRIAIISAVNSFICALAESQRSPQLDFSGSLSSGCASFIAAAMQFQHKIRSRSIFSDYELRCFKNGERVHTSCLRFATDTRDTPPSGYVEIACPV